MRAWLDYTLSRPFEGHALGRAHAWLRQACVRAVFAGICRHSDGKQTEECGAASQAWPLLRTLIYRSILEISTNFYHYWSFFGFCRSDNFSGWSGDLVPAPWGRSRDRGGGFREGPGVPEPYKQIYLPPKRQPRYVFVFWPEARYIEQNMATKAPYNLSPGKI